MTFTEKNCTTYCLPLLTKRKEKLIRNEKAVSNTRLKPTNSLPKMQKETKQKILFRKLKHTEVPTKPLPEPFVLGETLMKEASPLGPVGRFVGPARVIGPKWKPPTTPFTPWKNRSHSHFGYFKNTTTSPTAELGGPVEALLSKTDEIHKPWKRPLASLPRNYVSRSTSPEIDYNNLVVEEFVQQCEETIREAGGAMRLSLLGEMIKKPLGVRFHKLKTILQNEPCERFIMRGQYGEICVYVYPRETTLLPPIRPRRLNRALCKHYKREGSCPLFCSGGSNLCKYYHGDMQISDRASTWGRMGTICQTIF